MKTRLYTEDSHNNIDNVDSELAKMIRDFSIAVVDHALKYNHDLKDVQNIVFEGIHEEILLQVCGWRLKK